MRRFLGYDEKSNYLIGEIVMLKEFFIVIREINMNLRIGQLQRLAPRDISVRRMKSKNDFTRRPSNACRG
jgi:hypothetical protein